MDKTMSIEQLKEVINTYGTGADYMDINEGITYHISAYFHDKKMGLPVEGMPVTFSDDEKGIIPEQYLGELDKFLHTDSSYDEFCSALNSEREKKHETGYFHMEVPFNEVNFEIEVSDNNNANVGSFWLHFNKLDKFTDFYTKHVSGSELQEYEEVGYSEAVEYVDSGRGTTYDLHWEDIPMGWIMDLIGTVMK
jgi:hypothetical protein